MSAQPEALRIADECEQSAEEWLQEVETRKQAAAELRRLHDENEALRSDPAYDYCHRLAIMLECMTLNADKNFDAACALLDEYNAARDKWAEAQGQPYVSGFGKD